MSPRRYHVLIRRNEARGVGITCETDDSGQTIVSDVEPDGAAARAGIHTADVLLKVMGVPVASHAHAVELIHAAPPENLVVEVSSGDGDGSTARSLAMLFGLLSAALFTFCAFSPSLRRQPAPPPRERNPAPVPSPGYLNSARYLNNAVSAGTTNLTEPTLTIPLAGCAAQRETCRRRRSTRQCTQSIESVVLDPSTWLHDSLGRLGTRRIDVNNLSAALSAHLGWNPAAPPEGHSGTLTFERWLYATIASQRWVKTICEVGFNGGHSALLWLAANPRARVIMFDLGAHGYVQRGLEWLQKRPELNATRRLSLVLGSSTETVPRYARDFPLTKCDVISIDGGHTYDLARQDLRNFASLAQRCCTVGFIDDTPLLRARVDWAAEPLQALVEAVLERRACTLANVDEGPDRGVTMFQFTTERTESPALAVPVGEFLEQAAWRRRDDVEPSAYARRGQSRGGR